MVQLINKSQFSTFPHSTISTKSNLFLIDFAFSIVLLEIKIFLIFKFNKAVITDGTTPPEPKIKADLPSKLMLLFIIDF